MTTQAKLRLALTLNLTAQACLYLFLAAVILAKLGVPVPEEAALLLIGGMCLFAVPFIVMGSLIRCPA